VGFLDWLRNRLSDRRPLIRREAIEYRAIGVVRNGVREPRTSGWEDVRSDILLRADLAEMLDAVDGFSHAIVVFHLDRVAESEKRPVRVRVGAGATALEVGLFATRSPLRPNAVGVSVVRILHRRKNVLRVRGLDALNGTPVLDLKPYLPPYDSVPDARLPQWATED